MIDLVSIARAEAEGGDLFGLLSELFEPTDVRPKGHPEAVIWKGGSHTGGVNPVVHSLTGRQGRYRGRRDQLETKLADQNHFPCLAGKGPSRKGMRNEP